LLGGKCGRCVRLTTLPPSCAVVKKSGNLNFLEPSGPLQVCNGTALHLPPSCAVVKKSGNLNFLEPSGPLQVCNGTALPLTLPQYVTRFMSLFCRLNFTVVPRVFENLCNHDYDLNRQQKRTEQCLTCARARIHQTGAQTSYLPLLDYQAHSV
jgi:hypothetical protein